MHYETIYSKKSNAPAAPAHRGGSYAWGETGTVTFGKKLFEIKDANVTGKDDLNNSWSVVTVGTEYFGQYSTYSQVGSSADPAESITFTMTLPSDVKFTSFSAEFGGFSGTKGNISLTVDGTEVGSGNLNAANNVTVGGGLKTAATGKELKVSVTGIDKGVRCYNIKYTYEDSDSPSLSVNTTSVDFGTVEQNAAVEAKTVPVSLKNITSANVKLTGEGASAFEVSPAVLTASGNVTITPKTTTVGTYTAKLEISADGAETLSVDVGMTVREPFDGSVWEIKGTDLPGTSYAACDGEHGPVRGFKFYTKDVLKNNQSDYKGQFQFRRKPTGFLYNTTSFSNIVKIELETSSTFTVYVGKAEHPEAQEVKGTSANGVITYYIPEGNGYFTIKNGDKTGYISSIKVYYSISPSEPTYTANTLTFKASNKEGNWATFSNDDVTFFNDDVIVNTVVVENNSLVSLALDKTTANIGGKEVTGYYVPAKTGVLIYSIGKTVTYYVVKNKEVEPVDGGFNMLKPASEKMTEGFKFYKLAYDNFTEKTGLGFYWGAADGAAFTVKPGLAYLAVPQAQAANVKGFSFDGTQTGINGVEATAAKGAIYNLNGQRVEKAQRGIYIQNGKKFIVK